MQSTSVDVVSVNPAAGMVAEVGHALYCAFANGTLTAANAGEAGTKASTVADSITTDSNATRRFKRESVFAPKIVD